jgi:PAS domain S-box-containing protein
LNSGLGKLSPAISSGHSLDVGSHFAALVNGSADPMLSSDPTGTILSWNDAAARLFDYQPAEIIGQSVQLLMPSGTQATELRSLESVAAGKVIPPFESDWVRKDGREIPVLVTIYPVKDQGNEVIGASMLVCDLTDQRKADESRFRLAAIVDSADDAIVSKNLNSIVTSWNEGARRMFGYSAEEMVGHSILQLIPDELQYEEEEILSKLRVGERIDHYETRRKKKNGEIFDVSVTISPVKDESGRVIGASKIARDISDRKRIERMLIQSEKLAATGRMAAAIAHEINNPLESVMNLIYLARQHCAGSRIPHDYLVTAEEELERVSHIARQTLGYYKDTGSPVEVHLHDLIENVLTVYNSKLLATGITVDSSFNDLQKILASRGEMLQVFSNIISNAIDAMRQGGTLKIATRKVRSATGDGIQTVVRDTGIGIKQDHLENIFEAFYTTKGDLGTGLGLWVAKQLIEKRGGQISVASNTEPGHSGTTITVFLPFAIPVLRDAEEQR